MEARTRKIAGGCLFLLLLGLGGAGCAEDRFSATLGELEVQPDPVVFGEVPVSTLKSIDVTLINQGSATVHLHDLEVTDNPEDFSLQIPEELVFPYAITPAGQVVFTLRYHPKSYPEDDSGVVLVTSTDKSAPEYELQCSGTAVEPVLLVEPVPVDFGSTRVMSTSPATVSLTHTGSSDADVTVSTIQVTEDADGDFGIQEADDTPFTLSPGDDTRVRLSYTPQEIDDGDEGLLLIESDAESQERLEVPLGGSSHAPHIEVDTTALNFGTVSQGSNPTLSFEIRSTGNDPLIITEMKLSDTGSRKFEISPAAIADPIPPLDTAEVAVTYIADDRGDDDGNLMITHDDPLERPVFIQLHGRTPAPDVDIQPDYITIQIAKESHTQTADIRIHNVGDEVLQVTGMEFSNPDGSFSIDSQPDWPAMVDPSDDPAVVVVRFTKDTATVDDQCTLTFTTDDPDEQTVNVTVIGTYTP